MKDMECPAKTEHISGNELKQKVMVQERLEK